MKQIVFVFAASMMLMFSGCQSSSSSCPDLTAPPPPESKADMKGPVGLSSAEMQALRSKDNVLLSDELKKRLLANKNQLKLTPEEMQVLKATGKVIFCGKCGYLLNEKKYQEFERGRVIETDKKTGFAKDSLRERIIKLNAID